MALLANQQFTISRALHEMIASAHLRDVYQGVAIITVFDPRVDDQETHHRVNKYLQRGPKGDSDPEDNGRNYFCTAMQKIGYMLATNCESGDIIAGRGVIAAENGFRGGLILTLPDYVIYIAYSGGSEEQDTGISQVARSFLMDHFR